MLGKYAQLIRDLGHFPVAAEVKIKARHEKSFPSPTVFERFGRKRDLAARLVEYARANRMPDVADICEELAGDVQMKAPPPASAEAETYGFVYLLKAGRHFKIGRSNAAGRRERELAIQLPEKAKLVHAIKTDDPAGIEEYWHRRFAAERQRRVVLSQRARCFCFPAAKVYVMAG